jgi:hypothetical protein
VAQDSVVREAHISRWIDVVSVAIGGLICVLCYVLGLFALQFVLTILLYLSVGFRLTSRLGLLDARSVFFSSAAVYSTAGSADYYLFDDFGRYGEEPNALILAIGTGFMVAAGAVLVGTARLVDDRPLKLSTPYRMWVPTIALLMCALYVGLSVRAFGLSIGEIDRATLTSEQSTVAALARGFAVAGIILWAWMLSHSARSASEYAVAAFAVLVLTAFDLLLFGDRRIVLSMLLAVAFLFLNRKRSLLWLTPVIAAMLGVLLLLAAVREQPLAVWLDVLSELDLFAFLSPVNLDFGGFPLIANDFLSSSRPLLSTAPDYLQGLAAAVPSVLYPDRPVAFSAWYVQTYHPEIAAIGGGLASNWVIESLANFGVVGPAILGAITAGALNRLCSSKARWPRLSNAAALASFAFIMRYDLTSFMQILGGITTVAIVGARYAARPAEPV